MPRQKNSADEYALWRDARGSVPGSWWDQKDREEWKVDRHQIYEAIVEQYDTTRNGHAWFDIEFVGKLKPSDRYNIMIFDAVKRNFNKQTRPVVSSESDSNDESEDGASNDESEDGDSSWSESDKENKVGVGKSQHKQQKRSRRKGAAKQPLSSKKRKKSLSDSEKVDLRRQKGKLQAKVLNILHQNGKN
jgi:hypothetical protein